MSRYKLPDALGGAEFEAEEEWGGCAGGRPEYRLPGGISILMPKGTPMDRIEPLIPPEPEPGAYLIGNVLCVRPPGDMSGVQWLVGNTWDDWAGTWRDFGGPGVTITRLVPAPPEAKLPWTSGPFEVKRDGSPENRPDTYSVVLVHRGTANTVINQGASSTFMPAGRAEALAYALLAAARAAREAS